MPQFQDWQTHLHTSANHLSFQKQQTLPTTTSELRLPLLSVLLFEVYDSLSLCLSLSLSVSLSPFGFVFFQTLWGPAWQTAARSSQPFSCHLEDFCSDLPKLSDLIAGPVVQIAPNETKTLPTELWEQADQELQQLAWWSLDQKRESAQSKPETGQSDETNNCKMGSLDQDESPLLNESASSNSKVGTYRHRDLLCFSEAIDTTNNAFIATDLRKKSQMSNSKKPRRLSRQLVGLKARTRLAVKGH